MVRVFARSPVRRGASDLRKPWKKFAKLIAFTEGSVFHPGGWGAGGLETSAKDNFAR